MTPRSCKHRVETPHILVSLWIIAIALYRPQQHVSTSYHRCKTMYVFQSYTSNTFASFKSVFPMFRYTYFYYERKICNTNVEFEPLHVTGRSRRSMNNMLQDNYYDACKIILFFAYITVPRHLYYVCRPSIFVKSFLYHSKSVINVITIFCRHFSSLLSFNLTYHVY